MKVSIKKGLKALGLICKHPYLLNAVINDEGVRKEEVIRRYGLEAGLPMVEIHQLFSDFEETVSPYAYLSGATMPIDIALLRMLARRQQVSDYFEIGTWRGESVANMAAVVERCVTFNLPKEEIMKLTHDERYADLHGFFSNHLENVTQLYGNSQTFDFTSYHKSFDMVFIDGDHHYEAVKKDTETAFKMLRDEKSVIVWHDYALDPETVRWNVLLAILDGTPADKRKHLYHISNTLCAVYIPEDLSATSMIPYSVPQKFFDITIKSRFCDKK
ncbi:MAG: class I SAM-dependent methyltransferase [Bacteroidales bacterium]|nr:class I SAM-dependent methyltransferase [Bacteroidales bacterium]